MILSSRQSSVLEDETSFSFDRPIDMDAVDVDVQLNMEFKSTSRSSGRWDGTAYRGIVSGLILSGDCKMQAQGTADRDGVRKQFALKEDKDDENAGALSSYQKKLI